MAEAAALGPEDRAPTTSHRHTLLARRRKMWQRLLAVKFHEPTEVSRKGVPDSLGGVQP